MPRITPPHPEPVEGREMTLQQRARQRGSVAGDLRRPEARRPSLAQLDAERAGDIQIQLLLVGGLGSAGSELYPAVIGEVQRLAALLRRFAQTADQLVARQPEPDLTVERQREPRRQQRTARRHRRAG